jgi:hypothetical protein
LFENDEITAFGGRFFLIIVSGKYISSTHTSHRRLATLSRKRCRCARKILEAAFIFKGSREETRGGERGIRAAAGQGHLLRHRGHVRPLIENVRDAVARQALKILRLEPVLVAHGCRRTIRQEVAQEISPTFTQILSQTPEG